MNSGKLNFVLAKGIKIILIWGSLFLAIAYPILAFQEDSSFRANQKSYTNSEVALVSDSTLIKSTEETNKEGHAKSWMALVIIIVITGTSFLIFNLRSKTG